MPKLPENKRNAPISMMVTKAEKDMMIEKAKDNGFASITSFLVWLVTNFKRDDKNIS